MLALRSKLQNWGANNCNEIIFAMTVEMIVTQCQMEEQMLEWRSNFVLSIITIWMVIDQWIYIKPWVISLQFPLCSSILTFGQTPQNYQFSPDPYFYGLFAKIGSKLSPPLFWPKYFVFKCMHHAKPKYIPDFLVVFPYCFQPFSYVPGEFCWE